MSRVFTTRTDNNHAWAMVISLCFLQKQLAQHYKLPLDGLSEFQTRSQTTHCGPLPAINNSFYFLDL